MTLRVVVRSRLVAWRAMQVLVTSLLGRRACPLLTYIVANIADTLDCLRATRDRVGTSTTHIQHTLPVIRIARELLRMLTVAELLQRRQEARTIQHILLVSAMVRSSRAVAVIVELRQVRLMVLVVLMLAAAADW